MCYSWSVNSLITQHNMVQYRAVKWLESLGYKCNIEVSIKVKEKLYKVDVFGVKDELITIIECGYSPKEKLERIASSVNTLYIWPLNQNEPIIWNEKIDMCKTCGGITKNDAVNNFNIDDYLEYRATVKYGTGMTPGEIKKIMKRLGSIVHIKSDEFNDTMVKQALIKKVRKDEIIRMRNDGLTYEEIGNHLGITRERVRQLLPKSKRGRIILPQGFSVDNNYKVQIEDKDNDN